MQKIVKILGLKTFGLALLIFAVLGINQYGGGGVVVINSNDSLVKKLSRDSVVADSLLRDSLYSDSLLNSCTLFGIDVSHYQGRINWHKLALNENSICFVIARATMGNDRRDVQFRRNFDSAKKCFIVGAYHYYDPNQTSTNQALNYLRVAKLGPGNLRPILDIEQKSKTQSMASLRKGLKNWLNIVEKKYGVKPILYSNIKFYNDNLRGHFDEYPLWIAAYSPERYNDTAFHAGIHMHQYSANVRVSGVSCSVDGNNLPQKKLAKVILR